MTGIYKITNQIGRIYIGKTRDWDSRIKQFTWKYKDEIQ